MAFYNEESGYKEIVQDCDYGKSVRHEDGQNMIRAIIDALDMANNSEVKYKLSEYVKRFSREKSWKDT